MGSKKALGQAKRAWEQRIERPLQAVNLIRTWMDSAARTGAVMYEPPAMIGALAMSGWAQNHRTIYSVDNELRVELTRSGLPEESIPADILRRLPHESPMFVLNEPILVHHEDYDCLYGQFIVLPMRFDGTGPQNATTGKSDLASCNVLRIIWFGHNVDDVNDYGIVTQSIALHKNSLDLNKQLMEVMQDQPFPDKLDADEALPEFVLARRDSRWSTTTQALFPVATMLILYACSDEPDFLEVEPPETLQSRGSFKGSDLKIRQMGIRIGAALRSHQKATSSSTGLLTGTMTPHVRRAHWHRFWVGPRNGSRRLTVKWLPPIPVNVDRGEISTTVRSLKG